MSHLVGSDRQGRRWAVLTIGGTLRARLISGIAIPAVMDLAELIDTYGPLVMFPTRATPAGGVEALIDTVQLVASDPETASVEQISQVAAFARSIVLPPVNNGDNGTFSSSCRPPRPEGVAPDHG
ncbi:hypothetical protein ACWDUD_27930 [Rhodococcus sp. NPDC003382]